MKNPLLLFCIAAIFSLPHGMLQAQQAATPAYQLKEQVEVNTLGSWDKATIIEVGTADHAGQFKVHYEGWSSSYDRWLSPTYFRKAATTAATPAAPTPQSLSAKYQLNERIEVNTLGSWDKATIIGVGAGEHENEFKVHYDGYASTYDRWLLPVYFRKTSGTAVSPGASNPPPTTGTSAAKPPAAAVPTRTAAPADQKKSTGPRPGKYNISSYGAVGSPPLYLGHIELSEGGKYRISRKISGDYYGDGTFAFDAAAGAVQWLSGPCKENAWNGAFTIEREGKTHKIRLTRSTIATNNTD